MLKKKIIGYCAHCGTEIYTKDDFSQCAKCKFYFCSKDCYEKHECGLPDLIIPWAEDKDI